MDRELGAILEDLQQSLDLDEIVALEGVDHVGDVIPHLGVHFAGAVAKQERKVRLSRFFLPHIFDMDQESGRDHLIRLQIADIGRFHELLRGAGGAG